MPTQFDDALAELNRRLEQRGIHARVYVHDGMTAVMIHRDEDTTAPIDQAHEEEPEDIGEMAAQIAKERDLPEDWLSRLGTELPTVCAAERDDARTHAATRASCCGSACRTMRDSGTPARPEQSQEAQSARWHQALPSDRQPVEAVCRFGSDETAAML